ncbi:GNAT family N-acetyltransferase [Paenibacillus motobuensis]|uniref:GNAT family N-acetyltransferase n=1 Tax=Paenibacillus TaxID=44249 RepID=UPI00203CE07A|nr:MULTISPECIES: GNAT family N-acetyltransferase [Paenibacillus]MCM3039361.1 GNAT family N-acetyltransferase [Paenibacillus lutimineralis]MCM3646465.1 GNAT family N-acetyltransferase [Paenibacillus motobuensis]
MQFLTKRLIIREFKLEDIADVHKYASDPFVTKHMIWGPNTEEETKEYIEMVIGQQRQMVRQDFEFAVVIQETGELIGGCGLHISGSRQGETGYCFNHSYWGQGYATEAAGAMLRFGFHQLGLHRIYATCRPDNLGSAKVMQKNGMKYEGHLREHLWHKGKWHDSFQYSLLESEFNL